MGRRLLATGIITLVACAAPLRADAPTELDALLALSPSPGVELLLLPHAAQPTVQQRWRQALSDPNADRRAAAARVLGVAGVRSSLGGVMAALTSEQDPVARAELLRALLVIGSEGPRHALLRVQPEFLACQSERDADVRRPAPSAAAGPPPARPRRIKDEPPVYPEAARKAGIQGVVVIETVLTSTGCVADARVVRSIPGLDLAALRAVASWRYTPTLLSDRPVPVLLTVTINFAL